MTFNLNPAQTAREAAWEKIFTIRNRRHLSLTGPPAKQLKQADDTGFDALSTHKKCAMLTFSRATSGSGLKQAHIDLIAQPKADRYSWFLSHCMKTLVQKDPEAFMGFNYSAQFVDNLCSAELTSLDPTEDWWNGFIGHQLRRSPTEIAAHNQLFFSRRDTNLNLNINASQLAKLKSTAPVPIGTMPELLAFLKRSFHCASMFLSYSETHRGALELYHALLHNGRSNKLAANADWLRTKPGEFVYNLLQIEQAEFSHILTEQDFLDQYNKDFYHYPGMPQLLSNCMMPGRSITDEELPKELRPVPDLSPNSNGGFPGQRRPPELERRRDNPNHRNGHGNNNNANGQGIGPGNGNGQGNGQGNANRQGNGPRNNGPPQRNNNPSFHPLLQTFWQEMPEARRNEGMARWLRLAHTSTNQCLHQLGLGGRDCGQYHLRGYCNSTRCDFVHAARELPAPAVENVVGRLRTGFAAN